MGYKATTWETHQIVFFDHGNIMEISQLMTGNIEASQNMDWFDQIWGYDGDINGYVVEHHGDIAIALPYALQPMYINTTCICFFPHLPGEGC